jgi:endonuclease-3
LVAWILYDLTVTTAPQTSGAVPPPRPSKSGRQPSKIGRPGSKSGRRRKVEASVVMAGLGPLYGPVQWEPRYNAAEELVYTILSQHTSDINSGRAFQNLMSTFRTLEAVAAATPESIEDAIRRGGLAKQKSVRIKTVLNEVRDEVGSFDLSFLAEMPLGEAKAWLTKFRGIGPKTAAIILCFALGMPAMPVDTHIYRVAQRLGMVGRKVSAEKAHDILEPMVPPEEVFAFHVYLIKHGRQVCKAQRPRCGECVLAEGCPSAGKFDGPRSRTRRSRPARRSPDE